MKREICLEFELLNRNADISRGCAAAVGNFDGIHLGHRAMLATLCDEAKRLGLPSAVFVFDVNDRPKQGAKLLATEEHKSALIADNGVDVLVTARFSEIVDLSAEDFVSEILIERLGARSVICGYDFRFGAGRLGDSALIESLLAPVGGRVLNPSAVMCDGAAVSSTAIRAYLSQGDISMANRLLGREFSFSGEVLHGRQLGRTISTPTINQLYPPSLTDLRYGVYAVRCRLGDRLYDGVANVGVKPTVDGNCDPVCETYLFDYNGDCYGETAEIFFVDFIRDEQKFSSVEELSERLELDKSLALAILRKGSDPI